MLRDVGVVAVAFDVETALASLAWELRGPGADAEKEKFPLRVPPRADRSHIAIAIRNSDAPLLEMREGHPTQTLVTHGWWPARIPHRIDPHSGRRGSEC